jgi:competence ComEA-like helix-hairpin-helix protein
MPTAAERQALLFLLGVTLLGGGVRVWAGAVPLPPVVGRLGAAAAGDGGRAPLARQRQAVDAARRRSAPLASGGARARRGAGARDTPPAGPIAVNEASAQELERLPRVGPALARRIVADRAARGAYRSLEELARVPGIGPATLRVLAPAVTFSPHPRLYPESEPGGPPPPPPGVCPGD